jgi:AbrB family looped-hinge helix DNA binding protein
MNYMQPPQRDNMDMVTLGERGQVVIPAALRERLRLNPGDKLMIFSKHDQMLCMIPASNMRHMVDILTAQLAEIEQPDTDPNNKQEKSN